MSQVAETNEFSPKGDEAWYAQATLNNAVVVVRGETEIEFFTDKKNAGAWLQHVYGLRPYDAEKVGIHVRSLRGRKPTPGDAVVYDGSGKLADYIKGYGIVEGGSIFSLIFGVCPNGAYRDGPLVSASGGPTLQVDPSHLTLIGLQAVTFWRWWEGSPGADQGGRYKITVPLWRWDGNG